jgi:hypothetical protein
MFEAPNIRKQILIQGAVLIDKAYGRDCLSTDTHVRYLLMKAILPQSDRRGINSHVFVKGKMEKTASLILLSFSIN